jgi:hypothetical protein
VEEHHRCYKDCDEYGDLALPSPFDDGKDIVPNKDIILDSEIPAHQEFRQHPAHDFWKWSTNTLRWYHEDEKTGHVIFAPESFD